MVKFSTYSTAISYLASGGTAIICLACYKEHGFGFPHSIFGIIVINSLVGAWRYGNEEYGDNAEDVLSFTNLLESGLSLPGIATTIWCGYGHMWQIGYGFTILGLIPVVALTLNLRFHKVYSDIVLGLSAVSLGVVSYIHQNYYGVAAAVSYAFSCFIINSKLEHFEISTEDLFNYSLCFYSILSLRAVSMLV